MRLARSIIGIANDVKQIFMLEPRMVQVRSPAYVLGDIHGNFHDLLSFEKVGELFHLPLGTFTVSLHF